MTVLQVQDMAKSLAFYKRLGFEGHGWSGENDEQIYFSIVQRGDVTLALQLLNGAPRVNTHWASYIYVDYVDTLHAEFKSEGILVSELRRNEHYACDDFDVTDPDGHIIAFGQDRSAQNGPGLSKNRDAYEHSRASTLGNFHSRTTWLEP